MNEDQVKGKAKDIGGKIQEKVGEVIGSNQQQAKGQIKQSEGKLQEKAGDLKENLEDRDNLSNRGNR